MPVSWSDDGVQAASFLAIVAPPPVAEQISGLRDGRGLGDRIAPHITVKAQPNLDFPTAWRPAVRAALAVLSPFELEFGGIGWFGDGIVYLRVAADALSDLHWAILEAVGTVSDGERFEYEGGGYVPHLTVGAVFAGDPVGQLQALANAAADLDWPAFMVTSVVEFRRERSGHPYRPVEHYQLGGRRPSTGGRGRV